MNATRRSLAACLPLRVRRLFVLLALVVFPAATAPYADRLREKWAAFWDPHPKTEEIGALVRPDEVQPVPVSGIIAAPNGFDFKVLECRRAISEQRRKALRFGSSSNGFTFEQELGEAAGAVDLGPIIPLEP